MLLLHDIPPWLPALAGASALVLARAAGLAWTAPGWGSKGLGWRIRLGLALSLTALLVPSVGMEIEVPVDPSDLARGCLAEAAAGIALGLSAALVVAGARQAGEVVGAQAGLSVAALLDPEVDDAMTPMGHLYGLLALGAFLAMDGPLQMVGALVESYRAWPVGGLTLSEETVGLVFGRVGWALGLALRAAAPAALALVMAGLAIGLLARAAPALQTLSLSLPVRSMLGLVLVLLGLAALASTFAVAWRSTLALAP